MAKNRGRKILDNPFKHKGIEYKQNLVAWANELRNKENPEAEDLLAAALILSSVCEYAAKHLLESLKHLFYSSTYRDFAALVYLDLRDTSDKKTINQSADDLENYGFPDKEEIIDLMRKVATSRNILMHILAETEPDDLGELDIALQELMQNASELIDKIDVVYAGLEKILTPVQSDGAEEGDINKDKPRAKNKKRAGNA